MLDVYQYAIDMLQFSVGEKGLLEVFTDQKTQTFLSICTVHVLFISLPLQLAQEKDTKEVAERNPHSSPVPTDCGLVCQASRLATT